MKRSTRHLLLLMIATCWACPAYSQESRSDKEESEVGVTVNKSQAFQGYSLVAPMRSTSTYLIDMEGRIVNEWKSDYTPALSAYLLPNGHLLRPGSEGGPGGRQGRNRQARDQGPPQGAGQLGPGGGGPGGMPGAGGRIQEFDWDGKLVWDFSFSKALKKKSKLRPHHDICPLPNGNVLVICSDPKTQKEAIAAGRLPTLVQDEMLADAILEIKPVGKKGGEVVWEWYAWDHLIQDAHPKKDNYGDVAENPQRIDVNFVTGMMDRMMQDPEQLAKLRSLGYVGGGTQPNAPPNGSPRGNDQRPNANSNGSGNQQQPGPGGQAGPGGRGGPGRGGDWMHVNSVAYNPKLDQIMISVHEFSEAWVIDHSTTTEQAASSSGGKYGKGGDLLYRWGNPKTYRSGTNTDQRLFAQHCAHWIAEGLPGAGDMLVFNNGMQRPDGNYSTVDEIELPYGEDGSYVREEYVAYAPYKAKWSYGSKDNPTFSSPLISGAQRLPNGNTFICSGAEGLLLEVTPEGGIVWRYKHPGGGDMGLGGPGGFGPPGFGPPGFAGRPGFGPPGFQGSSEQGPLNQDGANQGPLRGEGPRGFGPPGLGGPNGPGGPGRFGPPGFAGPGRGGPGGPGGGPGGPGGMFRCYRYGVDYPGLKDKELTPGEKLADVIAAEESDLADPRGDRRRPQ